MAEEEGFSISLEKRWQKPMEATDNVQPKMPSSYFGAKVGEAAVAGGCPCHGCTGPSTIFERSAGCEGSWAALPGCHNLPCNFVPLVHSPHLCDKSSYFVHTHLKEGTDHPCAGTQLSRAHVGWGRRWGCHGNPSLCF